MSVDSELARWVDRVGWQMQLTTMGWELEGPRQKGGHRDILGKAWRDEQAGWLWRTFGDDDLGMTCRDEREATRSVVAWSLLFKFVDGGEWRVALNGLGLEVRREMLDGSWGVVGNLRDTGDGAWSVLVGRAHPLPEVEVFTSYVDAVVAFTLLVLRLVDGRSAGPSLGSEERLDEDLLERCRVAVEELDR